MIICVCNNLNEAIIDTAMARGATTPKAVFKACGSKAECGVCLSFLKAHCDTFLRGKGNSSQVPDATKSTNPDPV